MKIRLIISLIAATIFVTSVFYIEKIMAPMEFPVGTMYTIEKGAGLNSLAVDLQDSKIIRSPFWFKASAVLLGGTKGIVAGDYVLANESNTIFTARKFTIGDFGLKPIKITIPEGLNNFEISRLLNARFTKIIPADFVKLASSSEGYLFPDTYFFLPNVTTEEIIKEMKKTFELRVKNLETEISKLKRSKEDIIKIASIVELEGRTTETRKIIADILYRRLDLGIPLQVDVSFKYINGKTTKDLSLTDLKLDSPYNSYLYKGLPPTPISNPGLDSIRAAIIPTPNSYLYFLTDDQGRMHYAKTYAEHLQNKQNYLK